MEHRTDALTLETIARWRRPGPVGAEMEIHESIASTNTRARELAAQGAPHGTAVLARSQTAGRGRFDRRFHSPEGSGIYISFLLRPELAPERAVLVTPMAAVAVARAMEQVAAVRAEIKWVNDVYLGPRKACGILCEAGMSDGKVDYIVCGIGVNVGPMEFPEELRDIATSISNECGQAISRSRFCAALINEMNAMYPELESGAFMEEYRSRSNVTGKRVLVLRGAEKYPAEAIGIDNEGSLIVRTSNGALETLHSGEISVRFQ